MIGAGFPTSAADEGPTEELFEILEGETVAEIVTQMRDEAQTIRLSGEPVMPRWAVAAMLEIWAKTVEQAQETVGELLARTGLEEGDRIEIRFPTLAEDRARLIAAIEKPQSICVEEVERDADGNPAPLASFPNRPAYEDGGDVPVEDPDDFCAEQEAVR